MGVYCLWVILITIGVYVQAIMVTNSQNLTCDSNDLKALMSFINSAEKRGNWNPNLTSTDCCTWEGITCNSSSKIGSNLINVTNRVVKLELARMRIVGTLSNSIGDLDHLETLNLSINSFHGSIPVAIFNLPKLKVLDLSSNNLKGPIPEGLCVNASRLELMDLGLNYLTGKLPPGIANCSALDHLCLSSNYLTGEVPDGLFRLVKLHRLSLQDNLFYGKLSDSIGNLVNLVRFDISTNSFTGGVPNVFHSLKKLQSFVAQTNNLGGSIPSSLSSSSSLTLLNLNNNSFSGRIDLNCTAMSSLVSLDLGSNDFNGQIPDNLPSCVRLKNINMARNNFSSEIPETYKNFHSLSYLSLSNSSVYNISSALRILQQCKNLTTLVLTLNFADEEMPADPGLVFTKLKVLIIANCRFSGTFPQWLRGSAQLQLLDLSWNRLGGQIPAWIGDFKFMFYLDLSNNTFIGEIPKSLTGLESLINRSISLEEPSPDFPFFMRRTSVSRGLQYRQVMSFPPTMDLSYNNLSGPIWPEFENLKKLHFLDLKVNDLSGSIPSELSRMTSLETLDLSHNDLTGNIPASLVNLSFLSRFSVAYNRLTGKIPTGGQFQTFLNSSFEGNEGLCSDHTFQCESSSSQAPVEVPRRTGKKKGTIIGMAFGIGAGVAFVLVLIFVIFLRTHRRREINVEKEEFGSTNSRLNGLVSQLVMFQNKENSKELTIDELLKSTNYFDQANIIGCGGFGLVYKAILPDGRKVAIKRLSGDCGQMEREFQAEVEALSRAQHPNLVLLQGYCIYKNDRLLIYSYMENGSLDFWLHEKIDGASSLDWDTRLRIAQGSANGLAYLHQSCDPHILHRDIKSSNILLDQHFNAHLADFGLARLILSPYDTHITTDLVGTLGYIPPEYGQASIATYKGDIYSFGVVLIELLTGRRPMDMCKPKVSRDLISWVIQMTKEERENEVLDQSIYEKKHEKEMIQVLHLACLCLSKSPRLRPSTQQLVSCLDEVRSHQ